MEFKIVAAAAEIMKDVAAAQENHQEATRLHRERV